MAYNYHKCGVITERGNSTCSVEYNFKNENPMSREALDTVRKVWSQPLPNGELETYEDIVSRVLGKLEKTLINYEATNDKNGVPLVRKLFPNYQELGDNEYPIFFKSVNHIGAYHSLLLNRIFLLNTPAMMNLGRDDRPQQGAACFVLPITDSLEGIYKHAFDTAKIHSSGGGQGFCASILRPLGAPIKNNDRIVSSGSVSFIELTNKATDITTAGGGRRGANMVTFKFDHPDILNFLNAKNNQTGLLRYNVSVLLTDEFMRNIDNPDSVFQCNFNGKDWTNDIPNPFDNTDNGKGGKISYRWLWDLICTLATKNAEPGVLFIDTANSKNPLLYHSKYGRYEATNPCGEQFLHPNNACNLGSINLAKLSDYVAQNGGAQLEFFEELENVAYLAALMLNAVVDVSEYPTEAIAKTVKDTRPIGLGVMGFADLLLGWGLKYGTSDSASIAEDISFFVTRGALRASIALAGVFGAFPAYSDLGVGFGVLRDKVYELYNEDNSIDYKEIRNLFEESGVHNYKVTTVAPTGTLSLVADCSSGIEPVFSFVTERRDSVNPNGRLIINNELKNYLKENLNKIYSLKNLALVEGKTIEEILSNPVLRIDILSVLPKYYVETKDVKGLEHVEIQSAFQKYVDCGISKTINMPKGTDVIEVSDAFYAAWKKGCKGVTVYVDGSREGQILNTPSSTKATTLENKTEEKQKSSNEEFPKIENSYPLNKAYVEKINTSDGSIYVFLIYKILTDKSTYPKVDQIFVMRDGQLLTDGLYLSQAIENGLSITDFTRSMSKVKGVEYFLYNKEFYSSIPALLAGVLNNVTYKVYIENLNSLTENKIQENEIHGGIKNFNIANKKEKECPNCGSKNFEYSSGCITCRDCGYSRCG